MTVAIALATAVPVALDRAQHWDEMAIAVAIALPFWFLIAHTAGLYHQTERNVDVSTVDEIGPMLLVATAWVWLLLIVASVTVSGAISVLWFFLLWSAIIIFGLVARAAVRRGTRNLSWYRQDVVILGDNAGVDRVMRRIRRHPECGLDPVGILWREGGGRFRPEPIERVDREPGFAEAAAAFGPRITGAAEIAKLVTRTGVQRVVVSEWRGSLADRSELIRVLATKGVFVDMVAGEPEALCAGASIHHIEGLPFMSVQPTRMTKTSRILKRTMDVVVSGCGLVALSPLLAYFAIRIRLDSPGPALFRQKRAGHRGEVFEVVKFRTMDDGADRARAEMRRKDGLDGLFKLQEDPRITKYGAKLRKSSLDELPQLWNVFKGDMSLVGPRPLPLDEAPLATGYYADRLRVRPGITGPWQVHGRSDIPFEDMVRLDYSYVATWSFREDLRLLIRTGGVVLGGRGAY